MLQYGGAQGSKCTQSRFPLIGANAPPPPAAGGNLKKFWKVIREVIPSDKQSPKQDILLKNNVKKGDRSKVATFLTDYFINVGNISDLEEHGDSSLASGNLISYSTEKSLEMAVGDGDPCKFDKLREVIVHRVVREINTSKSSALTNVSSFIIKKSFQITYMFNLSLATSSFS